MHLEILVEDQSGKKALEILAEKSKWAKEITPHMTIDRNQSPSFQHFKQKLQELIAIN